MADPIADMLIRIKNAQLAKKETVSFGYSKIKYDIARILEREGWVAGVEKRGRKNVKTIEAKLIYLGADPKISRLRRISKPSRRIYTGYRDIFPVRKGFGMALYSTPAGILTDREARKQKVGGEILLEIW